jgi:hypothetical protein
MNVGTRTAYDRDPRVRKVHDDLYDIVGSEEGWRVERDVFGWRAWADEYGRADGYYRDSIDEAFAVVIGPAQ